MIIEKRDTEVTTRIATLREKLLATKPSVCTERARFYTEVYRENEDKPVIIKRALAFEKTLKKMTIFIDEGELIVGNQSSHTGQHPFFRNMRWTGFPRRWMSWISVRVMLFILQRNKSKKSSKLPVGGKEKCSGTVAGH